MGRCAENTADDRTVAGKSTVSPPPRAARRDSSFLADPLGGGAHPDVDLLLLLGKLLHRERDRRRRELRNHVDVFDLVPSPCDARGKVRLVLMVGRDDL